MCGGGSKGQSQQTSKQNSNTSWTPAGLSQLQDIWGAAQSAAGQPFAPYTGQLTAGFTPEQTLAQYNINQAYGTAQPYINQSAQMFGESAQNPNTNGLIQSFYNPMASNVMANLNETFGQQMNDTTGRLQQAAGGVGADRIAVGQAELARQQGLAAGQTMAGLYGQATQAAQGQQGLQQAAGFGFGQLGPASEQAFLTGANAQLGVGTLGQQTNQNFDNAQQAQFMRQQAYPFQTAQFLAGIGIPAAGSMGGTGTGQSQGTQTMTPAQPNMWSQILGAGIAGLGMLKDGGAVEGYLSGGETPGGTPNYVLGPEGYVPATGAVQAQQVQTAGPSNMNNTMTNMNAMTGNAPATSGNPLALAKQFEAMGKQGQQDKQGVEDIVNYALKAHGVDDGQDGQSQDGNSFHDALANFANPGWDATVTQGARGGVMGYKSGGKSNHNYNDYSAQDDATKKWMTDNPNTPYSQVMQHFATPDRNSGWTSPKLSANYDPDALNRAQSLARDTMFQRATQPAPAPTPAPAQPAQQAAPQPQGQQSVDIGGPVPMGMPASSYNTMPFQMAMPPQPQQSNVSTFNPNAVSMTPSWLNNQGGPQAATNAASGAPALNSFAMGGGLPTMQEQGSNMAGFSQTQPGAGPAAPGHMTGQIGMTGGKTTGMLPEQNNEFPFARGGIAHFDDGGGLDQFANPFTGANQMPSFGGTQGFPMVKGATSTSRMMPFRTAIGHIETGGVKGDPYAYMNPKYGTVGKYQIKTSNIAPWLHEAGLPPMSVDEFRHNPDAQDAVFDNQFGGYVSKYGNPQDAASMWFSGRPLAGNNRTDRFTGLSVPSYVDRFTKALEQAHNMIAPDKVLSGKQDPSWGDKLSVAGLGLGAFAPETGAALDAAKGLIPVGAQAGLSAIPGGAAATPTPPQNSGQPPIPAPIPAAAPPPPETALGMTPSSPGVAPIAPAPATVAPPAIATPTPPPPPKPAEHSPFMRSLMGSQSMGDDLENRYLMGEKSPMNFGFANGGGIRGYVAGGAPALPDDYTPSPIWNEMWTGQNAPQSHVGNHVLKGDLEGTSNQSVVNDMPPMSPTGDNQPDMGPFKRYDDSGSDTSLTNSPTSMSGFNPNLGGVNLNTPDSWGDAVKPGEQPMKVGDAADPAPAGESGYGKQLGRERQSLDELENRIKASSDYMTPRRAAMIEAGAAMMSNGSPFFGNNLGAGVGAGLKGYTDISNQYVNQAMEGAKAENMMSELEKPIPNSFYGMLDPSTMKPVPGTGFGGGGNNEASYEEAGQLLKAGYPLSQVTNSVFGTGQIGAVGKQGFANWLSQHRDEYDPHDIMAAQQTANFYNAASRTQGNRMGQLGNVIRDAEQLLPQAQKLSDDMDRTQYPSVNAAIQAGRFETGDPRIKQWEGIRNDIASAVSRAAGGAGGSTDMGRQMALDMLPEYGSKEQVTAALGQIKKVLEAYRRGNIQAAQDLHDQFVSGGKGSSAGAGGGSTSMDMATEPPVPGAVPGADGTGWYTKGPNGWQRWSGN